MDKHRCDRNSNGVVQQCFAMAKQSENLWRKAQRRQSSAEQGEVTYRPGKARCGTVLKCKSEV